MITIFTIKIKLKNKFSEQVVTIHTAETNIQS